MLITLFAIATELHLLFNNNGTIHNDFENLDRVFNRICSENAQPMCKVYFNDTHTVYTLIFLFKKV